LSAITAGRPLLISLPGPQECSDPFSPLYLLDPKTQLCSRECTLPYPRDLIRASSRDEVPERVSRKNDTENCPSSLLWSVNGIYSLVGAPKGSTYNSAFFCDTVVLRLFDGITLHSRRKSLKGLYIHLDNALPHNAKRSTQCLQAKRSSGYGTRIAARTSHQLTSSSLVVSSENSLNATALTEELKKRVHLYFRRNRTRNTHRCLRNMDQQTPVGGRIRRWILPSVNKEWKKMLENSVKKPRTPIFDSPICLPSACSTETGAVHKGISLVYPRHLRFGGDFQRDFNKLLYNSKISHMMTYRYRR
jgi:hypothetical protein